MSAEIDALVAMRKAGSVPTMATVWLDAQAPKRGRRWFESSIGGRVLAPEIHIEPGAALALIDLRCLVALDVHLYAARYTPRANEAFELLKAVPANTVLFGFGPQDDFDVLLWTRDGRQDEIAEHRMLTHYAQSLRAAA